MRPTELAFDGDYYVNTSMLGGVRVRDSTAQVAVACPSTERSE